MKRKVCDGKKCKDLGKGVCPECSRNSQLANRKRQIREVRVNPQSEALGAFQAWEGGGLTDLSHISTP